MNELNIALAVVGGLILLLGLLSDYIRRKWWASDSIIGLLSGILLSSAVWGILHPQHWGFSESVLVKEAARLTLAIGLMGVALRLPKNYFINNWKPLAIILGLIMPLMVLCSGLLVYWILKIPFWEALLIGAVISPTDPIVATSIVTGSVAQKNIPESLRHLIFGQILFLSDGLARLGSLPYFMPVNP